MVLRSLFTLLALPSMMVAAPKIEFDRDVRPILADKCFACHGPDEKQRKAKLRLDTREGALASLDLKKPGESELIKRLTTTDKMEHMPPATTGKTVSPAQVETLRQWIAEGAEYRGHWAFIAPKRPDVPKTGDGWAASPIDRFTMAKLQTENLKPASEAEKTILIRRVTLDLTGLPPTLKEIDDYLADNSPNAYEKVVDRLLGSVRYGERMALDWLDAARYADTNGYHIDNGRDMTRWREWVIEAFHQNKPYGQFTIEQLAGDLLPKATLEQKIASGFNRNHMTNFEGGAIPEEYRTAYIVDRVNTTSTVWMGLTYACCQCHDHKYDPLTQKEYYQLYAYFNSVPENGLDGGRGNSVPMIKVPSKTQEAKIAAWKKEIADLEAKLAQPNPEVVAAQAAWEKSPDAAKTTWKQLVLDKLKSKNGTTFTTTDGITVAAGPNPAQEVYTMTFKPDVPNLTALRLEVLPDDKQSGNGPGRSSNGNFVMTGFKVNLGEGKGSTALKLRSASADYSQVDGNFDVKNLLQPNGKGWAIHPQTGKPHHAIFELAEPVAAGKEVTVQLQFNSTFGNHQFSRFRLLATDSATPHEGNPIPANIDAILKADSAKRTPAQQQELATYYKTQVSPALRAINDKIAELRKSIATEEGSTTTAMVMEEMPKPRDTFVLTRGEYDKKGEKVTPGTPAVLPPLPKDAPANRLALAKWLVSPENPLMARVTVNRYWQLFFGTGLVKTAEDFGTQGDYPSHPELLDWLAVEFRESGWNLRQLVKLIVMSATYRQSSAVSKELVAKDPENRLLARGPRFRLQAEFIRDQALAVSGLMNGEIGGKSVSPYQPAGLWEELMSRADGANWTAQTYTQSTGKDLYRRTMYTFWKRTCPPPSLATLDAPDRETCVVRRSRTNTPLQALVLMNDPTYVEAARKFAERMIAEGKTTEERLNIGFRMVTGRPMQERESVVLTKVLDRQRARFQNDEKAAIKLLSVGESPRDAKLPVGELAAWTILANSLLNLDEALTRN
ncbi:PSD1 and planctomycete cytochrome C domain-containing protein [Zavarzinella formosa]|uniref:PSD1 and planctomycete cytochrome C domain-containing protein n=1 Tax=Zavarzinella formosa TaxID=360055 RepID=UPI00030131D6|nr:PSD1 and planctomycete cytochrome C domain-containing protein [Zavarzinella formosa]